MKKHIFILIFFLFICAVYAQQRAIILAKSELAGTLFVDGEQRDVLWANGETKIEITRPGIYQLKICYAEGGEETATVTVDSLKTYIVNFTKARKLGSIGPAGGFIFYDKGSYDGGWRYFEAAPYDIPGKYPYGPYGDVTGVKGYSYKESGKNDTDIIIRTFGKGQYAAYLARNFNLNGYKDWFLPSEYEIRLMWSNLHENGYANLDPTSDYWVTNWYECGNKGWKASESRRIRPIRRF